MTRRLYLDSADLFDIGDGRVDALAAALAEALVETNTMLVVSPKHVQDASRGGVVATESLVRAVERFQPVLVVFQGPEVVEPLSDARADIVVQPWARFRELVESDSARTWLAQANAAYVHMHTGDRAAHDVAVATTTLRSRKANELFLQGAGTLARGSPSDDPEVIVSQCEATLALHVSKEERAAVVACLERVKVLFAALAPLTTVTQVDFTESLRKAIGWAAEPAQHPGHALGLRLTAARREHATRRPVPSDLLDADHAAHFPYVDFATCDAFTRNALRSVLPTLKTPRSPVVLPNRHLDLVLQTIRSGRVT